MWVCRVELVGSKMVEKIFPKRRKAVVQTTCYEKLWDNAALLIMIQLMISFMMLTAKIARLITVVLMLSTRKEDCIACGGSYSCTSLTVTIPNNAFWKIWIHQTIDFHKSKPKYHLLEIQILDPKSNIFRIPQTLIRTLLFNKSTPTQDLFSDSIFKLIVHLC